MYLKRCDFSWIKLGYVKVIDRELSVEEEKYENREDLGSFVWVFFIGWEIIEICKDSYSGSLEFGYLEYKRMMISVFDDGNGDKRSEEVISIVDIWNDLRYYCIEVEIG